MLNYHHMTMNEPRDSPHRRQQFLVTCAIMGGIFVYVTIMAGVWKSIDITEGKFPGGDFVYKFTERDYGASDLLEEMICKDLGFSEGEKEDRVYTIFLDDPDEVADGRDRRFASGFLGNKKGDRSLVEKLEALTSSIQQPTAAEAAEISAADLFESIKYKRTTLPSVKAAVAYHPYTNGFVSSLMMTFRIIPSLRKYAYEKQREAGIKSPSVTVISTCSIVDSMCTHYAPLEKGKSFLLGRPSTEVYIATLPIRSALDLAEFKIWVRRTLRLFQRKHEEL